MDLNHLHPEIEVDAFLFSHQELLTLVERIPDDKLHSALYSNGSSTYQDGSIYTQNTTNAGDLHPITPESNLTSHDIHVFSDTQILPPHSCLVPTGRGMSLDAGYGSHKDPFPCTSPSGQTSVHPHGESFSIEDLSSSDIMESSNNSGMYSNSDQSSDLFIDTTEYDYRYSSPPYSSYNNSQFQDNTHNQSLCGPQLIDRVVTSEHTCNTTHYVQDNPCGLEASSTTCFSTNYNDLYSHNNMSLYPMEGDRRTTGLSSGLQYMNLPSGN